MNRLACVIGGIGVAIVAPGCTPSNIAPVSGHVTLDGKPLAGATVQFQPDIPGKAYPGPGSMATTGDDGKFVLRVIGQDVSGAVIGQHKVYVTKPASAPKPDVDEPIAEALPSRYNGKTGLTFEVPPDGTNAADFGLSSR